MAYETLAVEFPRSGVALVEIARPEKLNAMNHAFFEELPRLLGELDESPEVSVCVLTGRGRAFSVGGDFEDFEALEGPEQHRGQVALALGAFHAIERAQTVVLAAVNGLALAGGTELTLACDIAIAAPEAVFGFREVTVGLMPAFGVLRGPEAIGRPWTNWLALSGREISAERALQIGLVQAVSAEGKLLDEALELAAGIASHPRPALRVAKRVVNRHSGDGLEESITRTATLFADPEHGELIRGFLTSRRGRR